MPLMKSAGHLGCVVKLTCDFWLRRCSELWQFVFVHACVDLNAVTTESFASDFQSGHTRFCCL